MDIKTEQTHYQHGRIGFINQVGTSVWSLKKIQKQSLDLSCHNTTKNLYSF